MKKLLTTLFVAACFVPAFASALVLTQAQQLQMNSIIVSLTQILSEIDAASSQGTAYINSSAFALQAQNISYRIQGLQSQITSVFAGILPAQSTQYNGYQSSGQYQGGYTNYNQYPQTGYSSANFRTITVGDVPPNVVTFSINAQPNQQCSALSFMLDYGDGQTQPLSFPASCGNQIQTVQHSYPATGNFTARLSSGNFATTLNITTPISSSNGATLAIGYQAGTGNYQVLLNATSTPSSQCLGATYTLDWGDGQTQTVVFSSSCSAQGQSLSHSYTGQGSYVVTMRDNTGKGPSISVQANAFISAGQGDPTQLLNVTGPGNGSKSFVDTSPYHRAITAGGSVVGKDTSSIYFNGSSDYLSIPASSDFNPSGDFTLAFWVYADSLPTGTNQAGLFVQADSAGSDNSLGTAGVEFFGSKIAFVGKIGGVVYHPFYANTPISGAASTATWYHVAVVRSGTTLSLYINGTLSDSKTVSGSGNVSGGAISVGKYGGYSGNFFNGRIQKLQFYKKAMWTTTFDPNTIP